MASSIHCPFVCSNRMIVDVSANPTFVCLSDIKWTSKANLIQNHILILRGGNQVDITSNQSLVISLAAIENEKYSSQIQNCKQISEWMFVSRWKRYKGINMVLFLPLLSCESSVSEKENPDRKKPTVKILH